MVSNVLNAWLFHRTADAREGVSLTVSQQTGCSGGGIETAPGGMASGIVFLGQKANKWLKLSSVNTASGVH